MVPKRRQVITLTNDDQFTDAYMRRQSSMQYVNVVYKF